MSGTHSFLPPSGAPAWVHCAVWPHMNAKYPETEAQAPALEGEAAHWVLLNPSPVGTRAPNGVAVTDEMLEGADLWLEVTGGNLPGDRNEQHVAHHRDPLRGGTPDKWRVEPGLLRVFDYKFGHESVPAYLNWQLLEYAGLITKALGLDTIQEQGTQVEFTIVQPRDYTSAGTVKHWKPGTLADLRGYWNRLDMAADAAARPDPQATVGTHCKHCPGRHACEALERNASAVIDYAGGVTPVELAPGILGRQLRELDRAAVLLEARRTGLQAQALATLKAGKRVPFYAVEQGKGRERWKRPVAEVAALGEAMGVPLAKLEAITPTQARKAGLDPAVVAAFAEVPVGEFKLVADDGSKARAAFTPG